MPFYKDPSLLPGVGLGIADAQNLLKEFYLDRVRDQVETDTVGWSILTKTSEDVAGKEIVMSARMRKSSGYGFVRGRNPLADSHHQSTESPRFKMTKFYIRYQIENIALAASRSDRGAFVRGLDDEIVNNTRFAKKYLNHAAWNDASGRIAVVAALSDPANGKVILRHTHDTGAQAPWAETIEVDDFVAIVNASASAPNVPDFLKQAGGTVRAFYVSGVDYATGEIELETTASSGVLVDLTDTDSDAQGANHAVAVGDAIVRVIHRDTDLHTAATNAGFEKSTSYRANQAETKEMNGFKSIVSDTNAFTGYDAAAPLLANFTPLQAIDVDDFPRWKAGVFPGTGPTQTISHNLIQRTHDFVRTRGAGRVGAYMTSFGVHRAYEDQILQGKRYPNTVTLRGGWEAITHNGVPMVADVDCPPGHWFTVDLSAIKVAQMAQLDFMDADVGILKQVPGMDEYEATAYMYCEVYTDRRNACAVAYNIEEA